MRLLFGAILLLILVTGCGGRAAAPSGPPVSEEALHQLQREMTTLFAALEMYAHDHSLAYPDDVQALLPKYLDAIPEDPRGGLPLRYQRTERGYLISATGDYSAAGAEPGFPQMDADGFFALRPEDFPEQTLPDSLQSPLPPGI